MFLFLWNDYLFTIMQSKLRHVLLPIVHASLDVSVMRRLLEAKTAGNLHQVVQCSG